MSKLIKSLQKIKKKIGNCIVLGNAWGNLDDLVNNFDSVFIISLDEERLKSKNIVYRDNFNDPTLFSNINFVFINLNLLDEFEKLKPAVLLFKPSILIGYGDYLDTKRSKYFNSIGYDLTTLRKDYQVWRLKGKR